MLDTIRMDVLPEPLTAPQCYVRMADLFLRVHDFELNVTTDRCHENVHIGKVETSDIPNAGRPRTNRSANDSN